jgi:hypothetical protein
MICKEVKQVKTLNGGTDERRVQMTWLDDSSAAEQSILLIAKQDFLDYTPCQTDAFFFED